MEYAGINENFKFGYWIHEPDAVFPSPIGFVLWWIFAIAMFWLVCFASVICFNSNTPPADKVPVNNGQGNVYTEMENDPQHEQ